MSIDADFASVSLLLHFDGLDNAATTTDSSTRGATVSMNFAALDDAQVKFGSTSCRFDNPTARVTVANSTDLLDHSQDWTVEAWIRLDGTPPEAQAVIMSTREDLASSGVIFTIMANGVPRFYGYTSDTGYDGDTGTTGSTTLSVDTWHHVAWVHDVSAKSVTIYVDGTAGNSATYTGDLLTGDTTCYFGYQDRAAGSFGLEGWIDELRITNGVARYTGGFTAPTAAFPEFDTYEARVDIPSLLGAPAAVARQLVPIDARVEIPSLLGAPAALLDMTYQARVSIPSLLGAPATIVRNDFTALLTGDENNLYVLELSTDPPIEIPIKSWQATIDGERQDYVQAVIPAYDDYAAELSAQLGSGTFRIYKRVNRGSGFLQSEMAIAPMQTLRVDGGSINRTATISGYAVSGNESAGPSTRVMTGVRTFSQNVGGAARMRCDIDWFLRPGDTAQGPVFDVTVDFISYFVPSVGDAYMDVGSRGAS